jgi:hypothetical protein
MTFAGQELGRLESRLFHVKGKNQSLYFGWSLAHFLRCMSTGDVKEQID